MASQPPAQLGKGAGKASGYPEHGDSAAATGPGAVASHPGHGCSAGKGGKGGKAPEQSSEDEDEEYETDESECGPGCRHSGEESEKQHFLDVCWSFVAYADDAQHDLTQLQKGLSKLDATDAKLWGVDPQEWFKQVRLRVEHNTKFLMMMPHSEVCGADLGPRGEQLVHEVPDKHRVASRNASKVSSTLRQFVRDWAREGEAERLASYGPLIDALGRHLPARKGKRQAKVLCPGSGLGRLPFDLARLGYAAQGNEFSYHMLLGCHMVLNRSATAECHTIFPFVLNMTNRRGALDHLRAVKVPDISPCNSLPPDSQLSMAAGEFVEVYKDQFGAWDAVATAFFVDTAKNIFQYIRIIAQITRKDGFWINLGPLLFHYADVSNEISIELSWEEVKPAIEKYFDIVEECESPSQYAANVSCLTGTRYRCIFFVAKRNTEPISGMSHPVF